MCIERISRVALVAFLSIASCDGGGAARNGAQSGRGPQTPEEPEGTARTGGLVARFVPAEAEIRTTTRAQLRFVIENRGSAPATLDLDTLGSAILGLEFFDDDGQPVRTIPPGMPPADYTPRTETLAPGAERHFEVDLHVFSPPLPEGEYTVRVRYTGIRSETLRLSVDPGGP